LDIIVYIYIRQSRCLYTGNGLCCVLRSYNVRLLVDKLAIFVWHHEILLWFR